MTSAVSGIYKITNAETGKIYVGSAVNLYLRKNGHFNSLRNGNHKNKKLQAAYNKYGKDNFLFEEIELCGREKLINREQYWMDLLGAVEIGYNMNPIAGSALGRKFDFKSLTDSHRRKIGNSKKGKKRTQFSDSWRKKLAHAARKPRPNQSLTMQKRSERPSRRVIVACKDCSKKRELVISAAQRSGKPYQCRKCYLEYASGPKVGVCA